MRWLRTLRQGLHRLLGVVGASVIFTATFAGSLVLHGDLPSTRRFVSQATTRLLGSIFEGKIIVHQINHLGFDGLDIQSAEALDPWGQRVILVQGIHARLPVARALERLALGGGSIELTVDDLRVDDAEVNVDVAPDGRTRLQATFTPRASKSSSSKSSSNTLRIELAQVQVGHVWAHGEPVKKLPLQGEGTRIPGHLLLTEKELAIDVERFALRSQFLAPLNPQGTAEYHLRISGDLIPRMWASFHGKLGEVTADASAKLEGLNLSAQIDASRIEPGELRSLVPSMPFVESTSLHGEIGGRLPDLQGKARLVAGPSSEATVDYDLRIVDGVEASARWSVRHLDPRIFALGNPATSLGGDGRVWMRLNETGLHAELEAATFPFLLGEQVIPGVTAQASFDGTKLQGKATVLEPGVENTINFTVGKDRVAEIKANLGVPQLRGVTRLQGALDGSASVNVNARLSAEGTLDANVVGTYHGLRRGPVQIAGGTIQSHLTGSLDQLTAETSLTGESLNLSGFRIRRASLGAAGPLLTPSVRLSLRDERWKGLSLSGHARIGPRPSVSDLAVTFEGDEKLKIEARVAQVAVGPGGVDLRGLKLLGDTVQARGALSLTPSGFRIAIEDGNVNLARVGHYLAPRLGAPALARLTSGTLTFGGKLDAEGSRRSGNFSAKIENFCAREYPVVLQGEAHLGLGNELVSSTFSTRLDQATCKDNPTDPDLIPREQIASARGQTLGTVRGSLLDAKSWKNASGSVELIELTASLEQLSNHPLVEELRQAHKKSPEKPPIPRLGGLLFATAAMTRIDPHQSPSAQLALASRGFRMEVPGSEEEKPLLIEGLDLRTALGLVPASDTAGNIDGVWRVALDHEQRELAQLSVATSFRPEELFRTLTHLSREPDSTERREAIAWLKTRTARGTFRVPEQTIEDLPKLLRPIPLRGKIRVEGSFAGTADRPEVTAQLDVQGLHRAFLEWDPWKMSASLGGTFDERGIVLRGELGHQSESVPQSDGKITFWAMSTKRLGDLLWQRGTKWQADAEARFSNWRLESMPLLAARGIQGSVSGVVQAFRMHVQPQIWADLSLVSGKFNDANLAPTKLTVSLVEGGGFATVAMHQPPTHTGEPGGELALTAFPTITFLDRLIPTLDRQQRHPLSLRFSHFEVEPLAPLAAPLLADLRGKLDGELSFTVSPNPKENSIQGGLRWSHGVILIPQLGQTFTNGQLNLTTAPVPESDETRVEIRNASLNATSGRIGAEANLSLPNDLIARYLFPPEKDRPPSPVLRGDFSASIAAQEKIPITFEGLALGDAHGKSEGKILFREGDLRVDVAIPDLTFDLPETTTQQNLQDLNENPQIGVVDPARQTRRRRRNAQEAKPTVVRVNVGLGTSLDELLNDRDPSGSILVRRASVDVRLSGITHSMLNDELTMTGTVETLSGRIVALGKPFEVRRGFVRFEGKATNPYLNVGATWESPDGTRVFADLQGYLKEAQLRLRSEPARSESEVLSLVLFGRDPSANASTNLGHGSSTDSNLAVGSGVASTLLNSFIDPVQVFGRRIETRVESTSTRGTSIGIATEIRPRLWAQVDVSTSSQRERQNSDLSAVTLDWRFRPNWSLRTTIGDRGSSLMELLWQFKY